MFFKIFYGCLDITLFRLVINGTLSLTVDLFPPKCFLCVPLKDRTNHKNTKTNTTVKVYVYVYCFE